MPIRFTRSVDKDVRAWMIAVQGAGASVSGVQQSNVQALISSLKASGVWPTLDRLWLFAAENATQALIDLVARQTATLTIAPTFTANRGYKGNGTTQYINTGANVSTLTNFQRNSASLITWIETAQTGDGSAHRYAGYDEANFGLFSNNGVSSNRYGINSATGKSYTFVTQTGLWVAQRTGASAQSLWQNGASVDTDTGASVAVPSNNIYGLAGNLAGVPTVFSDARLAALGAGAGFTSPQNAALYSAVRAYMTAVGVA